jgi:hypothetical protein
MSRQEEVSADEFVRDLTKIQDEAVGYLDMHPDGKRKCLDHLGHTIQTLKKIESDLLKASDDELSSTKIVQVLWRGYHTATFTKEAFVDAFKRWRQGNPKIQSVEMQDNYKLDAEKYLSPIRMCFVRFSTKEDVAFALGMKRLGQIRFDSPGGDTCISVEFVSPVHSQSRHAMLRRVGGLIKRLNEIDHELQQIGAMRVGAGMPTLSPKVFDKTCGVSHLEKCKKVRAAGFSLDLHSHASLFMKPVDTALLTAEIKKLYNEECDILIELREHQLNGLDFDFKHPSS